MRLKKIILIPLCFILVKTSLFSFNFLDNGLTSFSSVSSSRLSRNSFSSSSSLHFDFNVGGGFAFYQTPSLSGSLDSSFQLAGGGDFSIDKFSHKNYSWTGGGFLGLGVAFGDVIPMALGVEYKGEYLESKKLLFFDLTSNSGESLAGQRVATLEAYQHSLDIYYKINFIEGKFPIGMQFLAGLAMLNPLTSSFYELKENSSKVTFEETHYSSHFGLGFHLGARAYFHMIYVGIDYSYLGAFTPSSKVVLGNETLFLARNTFNFSVGLMLNPSILKAII